MSSRTKERSQKLAAYLKEHQIERTHYTCPMSCGKLLPVNNPGVLYSHMMHCKGGKLASTNR